MQDIVSLLPEATVDTAPFWDGCDRSELLLPFCLRCSRYSYYPRLHCQHCGSPEIRWQNVGGDGAVYSFTHVHFSPFGDRWASEIPYCVGQIDLDAGIRFLSRIVGDDRKHTRIGDRVQLIFVAIAASNRRLPVFRRAVGTQQVPHG